MSKKRVEPAEPVEKAHPFVTIANAVTRLEREFSDPADIAGIIAKAGIRGLPGNNSECPLSKFLKHLSDADAVWIGAFIEVRFGDRLLRITTPPVFRKFIHNMDGLNYPRLVARIMTRDDVVDSVLKAGVVESRRFGEDLDIARTVHVLTKK